MDRDDFGADAVKRAANAPNIVGEMPQIPQLANAPNAPVATLDNTEFARPSGWGKLWRMERNGVYFKYRLRFTDANSTPQEFKRVTRQGGRISPKIERALKKRPGKGRHEASRVEAGRFRSRAIDLASRIRSSTGRGADSEIGVFAGGRGSAHANPDRDLGRSDMHRLPGVDGTTEMPGVWKSDRIM